MLSTLRQRDFALLWFGGLISIMGDWMLLVALPIYVYGLTGSALATGAMVSAGLLPNVILGSVAGVFVDRWDRRRIMAASFAAVWREWLDGLRLVTTGRVILVLFLVGAVTGLGEGMMAALFPPFVKVALGGGALELGCSCHPRPWEG